MTDVQRALFPFLVASAVISWISAVILVHLARQKPRIGFLTERAVAAVVLAFATTIYMLIAHNVDNGFWILDTASTRVIARLIFVVLGLIPLGWLILYWRRP